MKQIMSNFQELNKAAEICHLEWNGTSIQVSKEARKGGTITKGTN